MNYSESKSIFEKIKGAKKILINCHYSPDPDSVASCTSLYQVLTDMGKDVMMVCPDNLPEEIKFLKNTEKIKYVDYKFFDFSKYDLFIVLDCSAWMQAAGDKETAVPSIEIVSIDHHVGSGSEKFAQTNLIDGQASSTCEVLFNIFKDWNVTVDKDIATNLLTGIYGDTGAFQYNTTKISTLYVSGELLENGADMNYIVLNLFRSLDFEVLKFWGELLSKMRVDAEYKFIWSALNYESISKYTKIKKAKSTAASLFSRIIKDTEFGMIIIETRKGVTSVSLRERNGFDVSKIAAELGGGGHKSAAAAEVRGLPFDEAVEKVLEVARKYAKQK
ncbi:MAG: bifunctional oligoribonuclease/PAP phosphatase NrnA [Patescibacteria group bacterium]